MSYRGALAFVASRGWRFDLMQVPYLLTPMKGHNMSFSNNPNRVRKGDLVEYRSTTGLIRFRVKRFELCPSNGHCDGLAMVTGIVTTRKNGTYPVGSAITRHASNCRKVGA